MIALLLLACRDPSPVPVESAAPEETGTPAPRCSGPLEIVAGKLGTSGRNADGLPARATWLSLPQDVTPGPDGGFWIDDYNNHLLREVGVDGIAHVVAGSGFPGGGDGGPALAEPLDHPTMAALDPSDPNRLWFAATGNHRIAVLDRAASEISYAAGTGEPAFAGDGGPATAAALWRPSSLAFGPDGAVYVSDRMNQVIRRISSDGVIETIAGTPGVTGYSGDGGPATAATLNAPPGLETDPANRLDVRGDRLVFADTGNHAVREIDLSTGIITTLAVLVDPRDVAIAPDGAVIAADAADACVWRISGEERTVLAGQCGAPGVVVQGQATASPLGFPAGVAVSDDGAVWVADRDNAVILRFCP